MIEYKFRMNRDNLKKNIILYKIMIIEENDTKLFKFVNYNSQVKKNSKTHVQEYIYFFFKHVFFEIRLGYA